VWNKGKLIGQKAPFKLQEIWAIRIRLQMRGRRRELALFDLGIDSKLRACDLVKLRVRKVCHGDRVASRAMILQQENRRPVQFENTPPTREALEGVHQDRRAEVGRLPVPQSGLRLNPSGDAAVRPHRARLGQGSLA
jgi:hypothetical protein